MRVLGRAAHFISDMGCTVHVANMKYQDKANNVHYAFEKHVSPPAQDTQPTASTSVC